MQTGNPEIVLIAAMSLNGVIGTPGGVPWGTLAQSSYFLSRIAGAPVLMGRKTCMEIGNPIEGSQNIVITRAADYRPYGAQCVESLDAALHLARGHEVCYVIGGGHLFKKSIERSNRLLITEINAVIGGRVYFPEIDPEIWEETSRITPRPKMRELMGYAYVEYRRRHGESQD